MSPSKGEVMSPSNVNKISLLTYVWTNDIQCYEVIKLLTQGLSPFVEYYTISVKKSLF